MEEQEEMECYKVVRVSHQANAEEVLLSAWISAIADACELNQICRDLIARFTLKYEVGSWTHAPKNSLGILSFSTLYDAYYWASNMWTFLQLDWKARIYKATAKNARRIRFVLNSSLTGLTDDERIYHAKEIIAQEGIASWGEVQEAPRGTFACDSLMLLEHIPEKKARMAYLY